jgi:hypothetical protein
MAYTQEFVDILHDDEHRNPIIESQDPNTPLTVVEKENENNLKT